MVEFHATDRPVGRQVVEQMGKQEVSDSMESSLAYTGGQKCGLKDR